MVLLYELKRTGQKYLKHQVTEQQFRQLLRDFANDYSTHAELDRLALALTEPTPAAQTGSEA